MTKALVPLAEGAEEMEAVICIDTLRRAGSAQGFAVEDLNTFLVGEERVSSTRIRDALARGELAEAAHYLGRPYRICGRVAHGDARGRTIGFPTANVDLHRRVSPLRSSSRGVAARRLQVRRIVVVLYMPCFFRNEFLGRVR